MPLVNVEGPKVNDLEKKAEFVSRVTHATSELYGMKKEHIVVLIKENLPENVGVGGELVAKMKKE